MDEKSTTSILKEQFGLLAVLIVLIGTIHTESYYAAFGLKYQTLNLPASHIAYRGITALLHAPYLLFIYLAGIILLGIISSSTKNANIVKFRLWLSYVAVIFLIALSYPLASHAGNRAALDDLASTSKLPIIKRLVPTIEEKTPTCDVTNKCRLLLIDADYLYVFIPAADANTIPHIKCLARRDYHEIDTGIE